MDSSSLVRTIEMLEKRGVTVSPSARILDFGCGAGHTVYSLVDAGYANAFGFDVKDYLELRKPTDRERFFFADPLRERLPFDDDSFDLIISNNVFEHVMNQVGIFRELHRIMRSDGHALNIFPARYSLIEQHIRVPLGGVIAHRWWYKLWASLGIRNEYQKKLSAAETADSNAFFFVEALNYVPNSCYQVIWERLGYEWEWLDQEGFDTSNSAIMRAVGRVNRMLPTIGWMNRTFNARRVYLKKRRAAT